MKALYVLIDTEFQNLLFDLQVEKRRTIKSLVQEGIELLGMKYGLIQKPVFETMRELGKLKYKRKLLGQVELPTLAEAVRQQEIEKSVIFSEKQDQNSPEDSLS